MNTNRVKIPFGLAQIGKAFRNEITPKQFLFLCHLKPKSIKVKKGESVVQGQEIASVGNSGNTVEPHLHIHLQDTPKLVLGEGIPLYFHHYTADGKYPERGMPSGGFDETGNFIGQVVKNADRK